MSLLLDIERILKKNHANWLEALEHYQAVKIKIYRVVQNTFTKVYANEAGEENVTLHAEIEAIVVSDDFFPVDARSGGSFKEGWLFTNSNQVTVGDRIELDRDDFRNRRYKVVSKNSVGTTESVFLKYRLSSLGD